MPRGDLPGWHQVFADDFSSSSLGSAWGAYSGEPGGDPAGRWSPSHVVVSNGCSTSRATRTADQRLRRGRGLGCLAAHLRQVRGAVPRRRRRRLLLRPAAGPASGNWPNDGEIDFAEDGGGNRTSTTATLHYGANNSQIARSLPGDFTGWHTLGVERTPGSLV